MICLGVLLQFGVRTYLRVYNYYACVVAIGITCVCREVDLCTFIEACVYGYIYICIYGHLDQCYIRSVYISYLYTYILGDAP